MENALDVDLQDEQLVDEIRLVTELMVVATTGTRRARAGRDRRGPRRRARPAAFPDSGLAD